MAAVSFNTLDFSKPAVLARGGGTATPPWWTPMILARFANFLLKSTASAKRRRRINAGIV